LSELKGNMTHPDSEILAEFRAGLVTGRHGARISAHLAACERCAGLCDELAGISALLAAVPAPALPDAVAQRLEDVLAAEVAQRNYSERTVADAAPDRTTSPRPRRHWNFRLVAQRVLAPAGALAVLAAGGYGLSLIGSGSTSSGAASAASAPTVSSPVQHGPAAMPSSGATSRHAAFPAAGGSLVFEVVTSRTDYLRRTLGQQLASELQRQARGNLVGPRPASAPVKGCVLAVTRGLSPDALRLVETARFQGQPAIVIVAGSGPRETAWVTTPSCSGPGNHVLDTTTLQGTSAP
jgi:hypothetical protein